MRYDLNNPERYNFRRHRIQLPGQRERIGDDVRGVEGSLRDAFLRFSLQAPTPRANRSGRVRATCHRRRERQTPGA